MSVSSSINPVVDQLSDLALWQAELAADPQQVIVTLAQRLARVPDPRAVRGLRHRLVVILVLAACATLVVGNDSIAAIWQWAAGTSQDILARIGARYDGWTRRYVVPSERTFRRVLATIDPDVLDAQIRGYLIDVLRGGAPRPTPPAVSGPPEREQRRAVSAAAPAGLAPAVAIDGKLLRGSAAGPHSAVVLVAAIAHDSGIVLGQRRVADKAHEYTALVPLLLGLDLAGLDLTGMVLTLDALHTTRRTARLITQTYHAHYILILKDNQLTTLRTATHLLAHTTHTDTHTDTARGHARIEQRSIHTAPADQDLFPGARQAFRLHRLTTDLTGTRIREEIVHGLTSLPPERANAAHLNHYIRRHWYIENRLHWVRDVTFHEDASPLRTQAAPQAMAALRNLAISTYRLAARANIAHARRQLHHHADAFAVYGL